MEFNSGFKGLTATTLTLLDTRLRLKKRINLASSCLCHKMHRTRIIHTAWISMYL